MCSRLCVFPRKAEIQPNTTISKLLKAEQRFVRAFQEHVELHQCYLMKAVGKSGVSAFQEYVELHQRYLVKGEDVLNEWHMEKIRRRTNSMNLHGPYVGPPDKQKVCLLFPAFLLQHHGVS